MAYVEDRWTVKNKDTNKRAKTERYGQGLRWRVEWVDAQGKKRRKSFEHKNLAENFLTDIRAEQKVGVYRGPQTNETVTDLVNQYLDYKSLKASSDAQLRGRNKTMFAPVFGRRPASSLTRRDIQDFVTRISMDYSPTTVSNAYRQLAGVLKWARDEGIIHSNPCIRIQLPKEEKKLIRPLTMRQVLEISETMPEPLKTMVLFTSSTGLRISEARGVTWDRIDFKTQTLTVDRQLNSSSRFVPPKTPSSYRRIKLGPKTLALVAALRDEIGEGGPHGFVFHRGGRPISRSTVGEYWRVARQVDPTIGAGFHQLRHFHASQLIAMGLSPVAVAARLGHKDATETLQTYAHLWEGEDERMAQAGDLVFSATPQSPPDAPTLRVVAGF